MSDVAGQSNDVLNKLICAHIGVLLKTIQPTELFVFLIGEEKNELCFSHSKIFQNS